jgi:energy-coupling factor transport system ATP-binding protein
MLIEVKDLSYTYMPGSPFEQRAIHSINLTIDDGDFVGIIGHTGSGKSTFMQLLCGLLKPTNGTVIIDGQDIFGKGADKKWLRQNVGMVFQYPEYQLFEETVEKDIEFGPRRMGVPEQELQDRVMEAMALVDMDYETYKNRSPFELSGGQRRKIAMAGVLSMRPKILLMDEPIAGLDPLGRDALMELTRVLNRNKVTIVMISHNMDGLAENANKIVVFNEGAVYLSGTPKRVFCEHEKLRNAGLDLPEAARLVNRLRQKGLDLPKDLITYGEVRDLLKEKFRK